ncbi:alpha/beta fold hydrolase [Streptomyces sp. NBC_01381]|uniref:thioesterase II family protein n=1 Tax=Streptomyces sp. NBC_01381 TaxID=2903845 RepID=UPI00225A4932|nr:alpha/beta fold hydrolase [Streptomyces sp. NBC_01381]MCX4669941.1 alpha/beta fold hydrolase [Streptomyces sp. NBC_01381]
MTAKIETGPWIRRYRPAPNARARLLCLPHAGGSAPFYLPFARSIGPEVEVLAVQYPGRHDRFDEPGVDSIGGLADALLAEALPYGDRPLAIFGHSMGAMIAFELALRLEEKGAGPLVVFASGRRAPSRRRADDSPVHLRDEEGLIAELRALNGTDTRVFEDKDLLRMALPAIRNDYKAAETYRYVPGPPLAAPVRGHVGDDDPRATLDEVRSWSEHTDGGFELRTYPGGHFYLSDQMQVVAAAVREQISDLLAQRGAAES